MSRRTIWNKRNREDLIGLAAFIGGLIIVDSSITAAAIVAVADTNINVVHLLVTIVPSFLGAPIALVFDFAFPRWAWVFIIVSWIGSVVIAFIPIETTIDTVISLVLSLLFGAVGCFVGGWSVERTVDTVVAVLYPISSGIGMTGSNPFNFTPPELGAVAIGWVLGITILAIRAE